MDEPLDSPATEQSPHGLPEPLDQALAVMAGNFLVLVVVLLLLKLGYHNGNQHIPQVFFFGELLIIVVLAAAAFTEKFVAMFIAPLNLLRLVANGRRKEVNQKPLHRIPDLADWKEKRLRQNVDTLSVSFLTSLKMVMYFAALINFLALWKLIEETGGGIHSPFAPLLLAPAILGVIIVKQREGLALLILAAMVSAITSVGYAAWQPDDITGSLGEPGWGVFVAVPLFLVVNAAVVTWLGLPETTPLPGLRRVFARFRSRR